MCTVRSHNLSPARRPTLKPRKTPSPRFEAQTPAEAAEDSAARTELNLLGVVDSKSGEGRRNENVNISLIDNNVLIELNTRMGTSTTIVRDFKIDQTYWGTEFGGPPSRPIHVRPARRKRSSRQRLLVASQQRNQRPVVLPRSGAFSLLARMSTGLP